MMSPDMNKTTPTESIPKITTLTTRQAYVCAKQFGHVCTTQHKSNQETKGGIFCSISSEPEAAAAHRPARDCLAICKRAHLLPILIGATCAIDPLTNVPKSELPEAETRAISVSTSSWI